MTPQEKAKELFDKFHFVNSESVELVTGDYELLFSLHESDAKECALIALDELIRIAPWCGSSIKIENDSKEYYMKAKEEIKKL